MPINNPPGDNPQSGRSMGLPDVEMTVIFAWPFGNTPHVVITAWSKKEVWLTSVTATQFKWLNAADEAVTIDWVADAE